MPCCHGPITAVVSCIFVRRCPAGTLSLDTVARHVERGRPDDDAARLTLTDKRRTTRLACVVLQLSYDAKDVTGVATPSARHASSFRSYPVNQLFVLIIRPGHIAMQSIRCGLLLSMWRGRWRLYVSLLDTRVSPTKPAEPVEMPSGLWTRVGPRNPALGGGPDPPGDKAILEVVSALKMRCNNERAENGYINCTIIHIYRQRLASAIYGCS